MVLMAATSRHHEFNCLFGLFSLARTQTLNSRTRSQWVEPENLLDVRRISGEKLKNKRFLKGSLDV